MSTLNRATCCLSFLIMVLAARTLADDLTGSNKEWLRKVGAIILPEEEQLYRDLRLEDRPEFERIFWARRDPATGTARPENAFKTAYFEALDEAGSSFQAWGDSRSGWDTDCGRVYLLLGPPDMVRQGERRRERRQEVVEGRSPR